MLQTSSVRRRTRQAESYCSAAESRSRRKIRILATNPCQSIPTTHEGFERCFWLQPQPMPATVVWTPETTGPEAPLPSEIVEQLQLQRLAAARGRGSAATGMRSQAKQTLYRLTLARRGKRPCHRSSTATAVCQRGAEVPTLIRSTSVAPAKRFAAPAAAQTQLDGLQPLRTATPGRARDQRRRSAVLAEHAELPQAS